MVTMKLKIKIVGPKVHDVGYRVFLLKHAMNMALPGLSTYNWDEDGHQEVIVLVDGDEARVKAFLKTIEKNKPELAEVSDVTHELYDGDIGRTSEVAMFCSFVQLDKAIPLLLDMRDDLKEVKGDIKEVKGDIKEMKGDIKEMKGDIKEMKEDIKEVKADTKAVRKTTDATLEEIKGMREDIQPGSGMTLRQVQSDIRAIKEQLGMT
jgi:acylphosphatase